MEHERRVVTVQSTGKVWKLLQLAGVASFLGGLCAAVFSNLAGLIFCLSGVILYGFGRIGAWWFHS